MFDVICDTTYFIFITGRCMTNDIDNRAQMGQTQSGIYMRAVEPYNAYKVVEVVGVLVIVVVVVVVVGVAVVTM